MHTRVRVCRSAKTISLKLFEILAWVLHIFKTNLFFLGVESAWNQKDSNEDSTFTSTVWWLWPQGRRGLNSETYFLLSFFLINPFPRARMIFTDFLRTYLVWWKCYLDNQRTVNARIVLRCFDPATTQQALPNRMCHGTSELFKTCTQQRHFVSFYIKCKHWFALKEIAFAEWGQGCNVNAKEFCPFSQAYYLTAKWNSEAIINFT